LISDSKIVKLMGNTFEFTAVANDLAIVTSAIEAGIAEVQRIEKLLTTFADDSITNIINRQAGVSPVQVSSEVYLLIERSIKISKLTQGAFDITYGSIDKSFWNFDTKMTSLPDATIAKSAVELVNYKNVLLDKGASTVFLRKSGMRLGFGGIGKGYAAERAKATMMSIGSESGVVNAAGDLTAWGRQPNGKPWTIGIADPNSNHRLFSHFEINNMSIATSGDYEKYVIIDGQKYSHTIDPNTGMPVQGIKSASVICPNAELADALTTPLIVMGIDKGLHLINQLNGIEAIIIDANNKIYSSINIHFQ
jgi:FAD:protein FMN transferase